MGVGEKHHHGPRWRVVPQDAAEFQQYPNAPGALGARRDGWGHAHRIVPRAQDDDLIGEVRIGPWDEAVDVLPDHCCELGSAPNSRLGRGAISCSFAQGLRGVPQCEKTRRGQRLLGELLLRLATDRLIGVEEDDGLCAHHGGRVPSASGVELHDGDAALDGLRVEGRQIASAHVYQGPGQPLGRGEAGSYQVGPQGFETQGAARAITAPSSIVAGRSSSRDMGLRASNSSSRYP